MEDQPIRDPRILEAIEACRPGSEDLSDPSLAFLGAQLAAHPELDQLYERIQRLDARLARTFKDVPVPVGLADRLLARLAAHKSLSQDRRGLAHFAESSEQNVPVPLSSQGLGLGSKQAESPPVSVLETETPVAPPPAPVRLSRRRLWISVFAVATTILAAASFGLIWIDRGDSQAIAWESAIREAMDRPVADPGGESLQPLSSAPDKFPFSRDLQPFAKTQWRVVRDFLGRGGIAYDMVAPDRTRATLYVVRGTAADLPSVPEIQRIYSTPQRSASAWQDNGLVYVLVVDGGPRKYQQFLNLPRGPIT